MTGGVIVSEYPTPMKERATVFFRASSRNSASASASDLPSDKFSGRSSRIFWGTVASISSSRFSKPSSVSISARAWLFGPIWRCAKESTRSSSRGRREAEVGAEVFAGDSVSALGIRRETESIWAFKPQHGKRLGHQEAAV